MKIFGLIGYPLSHSFSKKFFEEKFRREQITDCVYENFPLASIEELPSLIESRPSLVGLNVTIPYKEQVIPFLSSVNDVANEIGAVNTIQLKDGKLFGSNTDVFGFMQSINKVMASHHSRALVLGTGGSSKAVVYGFKKMGVEYRLVSRRPESENEISYDDLDRNLIRQFTVIVNTTPLGMFPNTDQCPPLPYESLTSSHLLFDLVYNPEETLFLKKGKAAGATTKNGLEMLQLQAERSWQTWNS